MKKLTSVLGAIAFAVGFSSCSKETDQKDQIMGSPVQKSATTDFLTDFYGTSAYTLGSTISTTDDSTTYVVTEVILDGDTEARGYIAKQSGSETLLYFMDVNRADDEATTVDVVSAETTTRTNLSNDDEYIATNEFDVMAHISAVNDDHDQGGGVFIGGRKFWGKDTYDVGPCLYGQQLTTTDRYAFWIKIGSTDNPPEPC